MHAHAHAQVHTCIKKPGVVCPQLADVLTERNHLRAHGNGYSDTLLGGKDVEPAAGEREALPTLAIDGLEETCITPTPTPAY